MPTKVETQAFIRKHKSLLKVKLSGSSVSELNKLVDKSIDKLEKEEHRAVSQTDEKVRIIINISYK